MKGSACWWVGVGNVEPGGRFVVVTCDYPQCRLLRIFCRTKILAVRRIVAGAWAGRGACLGFGLLPYQRRADSGPDLSFGWPPSINIWSCWFSSPPPLTCQDKLPGSRDRQSHSHGIPHPRCRPHGPEGLVQILCVQQMPLPAVAQHDVSRSQRRTMAGLLLRGVAALFAPGEAGP